MSKKKIYLSEAQVNDVIGQDGYLDNSDTTNNITDTNHETMEIKPEMPQETPMDKQALGATNSNLHNAKREKNDEFYTKNADIEKELQHYLPYLKGKRVVCPCDTENSEFVKYFKVSLACITFINKVLKSDNHSVYRLRYASVCRPCFCAKLVH